MAIPALEGEQRVPFPSAPALREASFDSGEQGALSEIPAQEFQKLMALGELLEKEAGARIVEQYHQGRDFYFLLRGTVDFEISIESASERIRVGTAETRFTPVGWSAFRAPHRYATTVLARTEVELLRFDVRQLEALFATDPTLGWLFFRAITRPAAHLLLDARERLVKNLRVSSSISNWGSAFDRARALSRRDRASRRASSLPPSSVGAIRSEESMVTNAAPELLDVLLRSGFFVELPGEFLNLIAAHAKVRYFCRGDVLCSQGDLADALQILAAGKLRMEYSGSSLRTAVLGMLTEPGTLVSAAASGVGGRCDVTARATRDGCAIVLPTAALELVLREYPTWACLFQKRVLWFLSRQLRVTRAHLVSEAFDQESLAIESVLEQVRTELRVSSPLHKLPHLLKATVTFPDALNIVDKERESTDRIAAHTAQICHELLAPLRRENRFFTGLQATYESVVAAPATESAEETRRRAAENFIRVFSEIPTELIGEHNLPSHSGNIFVFNHLKNHEHNTLPNGFQLTLDSNFISSMILHKKYGEPGVRVVRQSRANEYGHQDYYARQGHIPVYTPESDAPTRARSERFRDFVCAAATQLGRGHNLVLAPEGTSYSTEMSPGPFKAGAFRLAAAIDPEPLVVPIAMAHFDRRLLHTKLVAVVQRPFRVSDAIFDPTDPTQMQDFLEKFRQRFSIWVAEAAAIGRRR